MFALCAHTSMHATHSLVLTLTEAAPSPPPLRPSSPIATRSSCSRETAPARHSSAPHPSSLRLRLGFWRDHVYRRIHRHSSRCGYLHGYKRQAFRARLIACWWRALIAPRDRNATLQRVHVQGAELCSCSITLIPLSRFPLRVMRCSSAVQYVPSRATP